MANGKTGKGSGFLAALLVIIDLGLLVWIGTSWYSQREAGKQDEYFAGTGTEEEQNGGISSGYATDPGSSASSDGSEWGSTSSDASQISPVVPAGDASSDTANASSGSSSGGTSDPSGSPVSSGMNDNWLLGSSGKEPAGEEAREDGAARFGSVGRPETSDFQTWFEHNITGSIPSDARILTDFREITGSWKGLLRYSNPDLPDVVTSELVNFTVAGTSSDSSLTVDWYLIWWSGDGEWLNEEDMDDTVFSGSFADGTLAVNGTGNIRLTAFYEWQGSQYAAGELDAPDGSTAVVGMVRP